MEIEMLGPVVLARNLQRQDLKKLLPIYNIPSESDLSQPFNITINSLLMVKLYAYFILDYSGLT